MSGIKASMLHFKMYFYNIDNESVCRSFLLRFVLLHFSDLFLQSGICLNGMGSWLGSKHKHWGGVRRKKNFIGDTKFWFVEHFLLKSLFLNLGLVSLSPMDSMFGHLPNLT